jgi:hypothetical protein
MQMPALQEIAGHKHENVLHIDNLNAVVHASCPAVPTVQPQPKSEILIHWTITGLICGSGGGCESSCCS